MIIYKKGDPKTTKYIQKLMLISRIIKVSSILYVTSSQWGEIIAELDAQYRGALTNPENPAPWDGKGGNRPIVIGTKDPKLTVVNSGTEDQEVCNMLNFHGAEVAEFGARRDYFRIA